MHMRSAHAHGIISKTYVHDNLQRSTVISILYNIYVYIHKSTDTLACLESVRPGIFIIIYNSDDDYNTYLE